MPAPAQAFSKLSWGGDITAVIPPSRSSGACTGSGSLHRITVWDIKSSGMQIGRPRYNRHTILLYIYTPAVRRHKYPEACGWNQGKAKAMTVAPAATAMYCFPPMPKVTGGATMEPPV